MPVASEMAFASIRVLGQQLRGGVFSAVELADFFLNRLETLGREHNAVVTVTRKLALEQAAQADRELAAGRDRGPLHGIPYGAKDLLSTKGIPTSWGAAPFRDRVIDSDATVVARLRDSGAVLAAKLSMVAFAGGLGYSSAHCTFSGPQLNPWDKGRFAGGSSSGPGAAVGGGMVPFAIGSETWGSIISPAHYCGICGLRPTYGRVSRYGAMALSFTLDKLGPMCRTAEDCGLVLAAIAGADDKDPSAIDRPYHYPAQRPKEPPYRLATIAGCADKVQQEVKANFQAALEALKPFATIEEIELPERPYSTVISTILASEKAAAFEDLAENGQVWELVDERSRWGLYPSLVVPAKDYINAMRIRRPIQKEIDKLMADYDAVLTPTLGFVAYPSDKPFSEYSEGRGIRHINMGAAANLTGLPGISIPNGFGQAGLPTGLNLVGRALAENRLLEIAKKYQSVTDWHTKHPDI